MTVHDLQVTKCRDIVSLLEWGNYRGITDLFNSYRLAPGLGFGEIQDLGIMSFI